MENKKILFKDIRGMLSRDEMKQIRGGSGGINGTCTHPGAPCVVQGSGSVWSGGFCTTVTGSGCVCLGAGGVGPTSACQW